jgi:hypothetical protein
MALKTTPKKKAERAEVTFRTSSNPLESAIQGLYLVVRAG